MTLRCMKPKRSLPAVAPRTKTMTHLQRLLTAAVTVVMVACSGGGGDAGTNPFGGGTPTTPGTAVAADLSINLSAPSLSNSGTESVTATVTAVDANRNTVSGIPVTISVDNLATVAVSGNVTGTAGTVTGVVSVGGSRANRTVLITAVSGQLTRQVSLQIIGTRLTSTALPAVLAPSAAGVVQYRVVDANSNPLSNTPITINGPGGAQSTANTGSNGEFVYQYTAPTAAGNLDISASAGGATLITTVIVQSSATAIPPVTAGSVRSASVSANPSVVPVNSSAATANRAEIRALFVGDSNAPIRNIRVRFDLAGDNNRIGGTFTTGTSIVYSDVNGIANSAYVPSARFSPTDGLTIRACWDYVDFAAGACPNSTTATLTVSSDALSVSIGTDETIVLSDLSYVKRFLVQVNDSSGLAKADVQVSPLLDLTSYSKGQYAFIASKWVQQVTTANCENEDVNRNAVLEIYSNGGAEDANGNRQLDPRKADVAVAFEDSGRTNASGQVVIRLTYLRNVASWIKFNLTVAAAGVAGTEGRASYQAILPVPAAALAAETPPAFVRSPYGVLASPSIILTTPNGSASASLCTNGN